MASAECRAYLGAAILYADDALFASQDNAINRKVLERQLKKAGAAKVLLALDGQEGLAAFDDDRAKRKIDAIIMDIEVGLLLLSLLVSITNLLLLAQMPVSRAVWPRPKAHG